VDADHLEAELERLRHSRPRLVRRQPELRAVVARADRLVGVGVDAEGHPDERLPDTCRGCEPRLVRRVEHDGRAHVRSGCEEGGVLVVPVHDELAALQTGRGGERELPRRGDVSSDPLLAQHAQERDVRQRLRPEEDAPVADSLPEGACSTVDRVLAEDEKGRSILRRERIGGETAHREPAAVERGGVGEERQHGPIVPVSIEHVEQLLT
jgi:hypothetical protein